MTFKISKSQSKIFRTPHLVSCMKNLPGKKLKHHHLSNLSHRRHYIQNRTAEKFDHVDRIPGPYRIISGPYPPVPGMVQQPSLCDFNCGNPL
jgi:hypothetical protein